MVMQATLSTALPLLAQISGIFPDSLPRHACNARVAQLVAHAAPLIFAPDFRSRQLGFVHRLTAAAAAVACLAVLVVAARMRPSPTGVGTHAQWGFNSCQFLERTRLPCPTCGMTTSFAYFVRGNFLASLYVQPMGFLGAAMTAAACWIAAYMALSGKPALRLLQWVPYRYYLIPLLSLAVAAWGWKMLLQIRGIDGWG